MSDWGSRNREGGRSFCGVAVAEVAFPEVRTTEGPFPGLSRTQQSPLQFLYVHQREPFPCKSSNFGGAGSLALGGDFGSKMDV